MAYKMHLKKKCRKLTFFLVRPSLKFEEAVASGKWPYIKPQAFLHMKTVVIASAPQFFFPPHQDNNV